MTFFIFQIVFSLGHSNSRSNSLQNPRLIDQIPKQQKYNRKNVQFKCYNPQFILSEHKIIIKIKNVIKEFVRTTVVYIEMDYHCNDWKHFRCVLRNHRSPKKRHKGQNLQCQLGNEDDLQSKSVIKKIVLRIVFYIKIDYHRSSVMTLLNSLTPTRYSPFIINLCFHYPQIDFCRKDFKQIV